MKNKLSFLVIIIVLLLSGCGNNEVPVTIRDEFKCEVVIGSSLDSFDCLREIDSINSYKEAVKIGNKILKELQDDGFERDYCLSSMIHYTNNNTWYFIYGIDEEILKKNPSKVYGCYNVIVDGNCGELIASWPEEG